MSAREWLYRGGKPIPVRYVVANPHPASAFHADKPLAEEAARGNGVALGWTSCGHRGVLYGELDDEALGRLRAAGYIVERLPATDGGGS